MNNNKIFAIVLVAAVLLVGVVWYASSRDSTTENLANSNSQTKEPMTPVENNTNTSSTCQRTFNNETMNNLTADLTNNFVTLSVENFGDIKIELNKAQAPVTSENFLKLVQGGFYDCLTFHRVARGFVIQGGDPAGNGSGGPGYTVPAEIGLLHTKGAVAMARLGDQVNPNKESSGSQFYIALEDIAQLDGEYTVFGQVVSGMDVAEKIGLVEITPGPFGGSDGAPTTPVVITKAVASKE